MHLFLSALLDIASIAAWIKDGDVISIDGKVLRGAHARKQSTRMRMMVSACATQLGLTLAPYRRMETGNSMRLSRRSD